MVSTASGVGAAFWAATRAAVFTAFEVLVAPDTISHPSMFSIVASFPRSFVLNPLLFVAAFLKYVAFSVLYPEPGVTAMSENLPSATVILTLTSYSSHAFSSSSSSAVLVT